MATSDDSGMYIGTANTALPADSGSQGKRFKGAAEMRQIKIQQDNTWPNFVGAAVNVTEANLNSLVGITGLVETRLDSLEAIDPGLKADKVTSATNGNLAGLDSNGNLTDSTIAPGTLATVAALATKADTSALANLLGIAAGSVSATSGYVTLDTSGVIGQDLIIQFGQGTTPAAVTFPIAFPTAVVSFVATSDLGVNGGTSTSHKDLTTTGATIYAYSTSGGWVSRAVATYWLAVGY